MLRKIGIIAVVSMLLVAVSASVALAGAAKFHSATSSVNAAGALVVNFDERGLGNGNIDYTLTADVTALYHATIKAESTRRLRIRRHSKAK